MCYHQLGKSIEAKIKDLNGMILQIYFKELLLLKLNSINKLEKLIR